MSGNCLEELDSQPEVLAGKQFSVANIVALDAVDRRQMKVFRQDVARTHEKTLGITSSDAFQAEDPAFSPGAATEATAAGQEMLTSI